MVSSLFRASRGGKGVVHVIFGEGFGLCLSCCDCFDEVGWYFWSENMGIEGEWIMWGSGSLVADPVWADRFALGDFVWL